MSEEQKTEKKLAELAERIFDQGLSFYTLTDDATEWWDMCAAINPDHPAIQERVLKSRDAQELVTIREQAAFALGLALGRRMR